MTSSNFELDVQRSNPALDYLSGIRRAKAAGKSLGSMVMEIIKLRRGPGKLQPEEYFMYGLYDDERFSPEAKRTFLGQNNLLLPSSWADIARDKPTFSALLRGLNLPIPETQAIVHPTRDYPGAISLRGREDICRFLRDEANYPIFGKPFDSVCSMGTAKINAYDPAQDAAILGDGTAVSVEVIAEVIDDLGLAYLFQTLLRPHEDIEALIGPCVSSVRMFVMSDENGCSLFRAAWKIPATANDADNFWREGNILAGVDVVTGKIGRTLVRTQSGTEPIAEHPITGVAFDSMTFPHWDQMRETVLAAANQIPSCHFQGWDVALTDQGPILVELEGDGGNPIMEQLCFDSGLLQERYLRIVEAAKERDKQARSTSRAQEAAMLKRNFGSLKSAPTETPSVTSGESDPPVAESTPNTESRSTTSVVAPPLGPTSNASVSQTNSVV